MHKPTQRSIDELLDAYRDYLLSNVSKVRILGEANERELKDVFVELTVVEQRTPQQHTEFLGMIDSATRGDSTRSRMNGARTGTTRTRTTKMKTGTRCLNCRGSARKRPNIA